MLQDTKADFLYMENLLGIEPDSDFDSDANN